MANTKYTALRSLSRTLADACDALRLAREGHDTYGLETLEHNVELIIDDLKSFINFAFYPVRPGNFLADEYSGVWEVCDNDGSVLIDGYHNRIRFY